MNREEFMEKLRGIAGGGSPESRRDALLGLHRYESMKADWQRKNRGATPAEYQAAMKRIATECGV